MPSVSLQLRWSRLWLLFGAAIGRAVVSAAIDASTGYRVAFDDLSIGGGSLDARGVMVTNAAGEPVLEADRLLASYRLRDLLPGGERRYGLQSVELGSAAPASDPSRGRRFQRFGLAFAGRRIGRVRRIRRRRR